MTTLKIQMRLVSCRLGSPLFVLTILALEVINRPDTADSPSNTPKQNRDFFTPVASFSKGSNFKPKTPASPGTWLSTPAVKRSVSDDEVENTSRELSSGLAISRVNQVGRRRY